jgi:WD40 repeat protein
LTTLRLKTPALGWKSFAVLSPDGRTLVSFSAGNSVDLWEIPSGKHLDTLPRRNSFVLSAAFSPDGNLLAIGRGDVEIWNLALRKPITTLPSQQYGVSSLAFSRDGRTLASGSTDGVKLWNVNTGYETLMLHLNGVSQVGFSPDGNTLAATSLERTTRLWRAASLEELAGQKRVPTEKNGHEN